MPTIWGVRDGADLRPYRMHAKALKDVPEGVRLRISVDEDRNGKFSGLYHVMMSRLADAINRGPARTSIKDLKNWVKLQRGWYDIVTLPKPLPTGETTAVEYRSTSFDSMGEDQFHEFARDTCDLIARDLAPWVRESPEWPEIRNIIRTILPEAD